MVNSYQRGFDYNMKRYRVYVLIVVILSALLICEIKYDNSMSLDSININTLDSVSTKYSDGFIALANSANKSQNKRKRLKEVEFDKETIELDTEKPVINFKKKIYSKKVYCN